MYFGESQAREHGRYRRLKTGERGSRETEGRARQAGEAGGESEREFA